jgi:diguanylate cyclase (GGDEF)-like protein/PAS domain S-box-containing protein
MTAMRKVFHFLLILLGGLMAGNVLAAQVSRIGVLSFRPKSETLAQWLPTAQALRTQLPQREFEFVPMTYEELDAAVASASIDFAFTNPEHYVVLRNQHSLRPLATLNLLFNGQVLDQFGSVIFTRLEQGIFQLADVRGKRVAAVGKNSLGGFLMAADVFRTHDLNLVNGEGARLSFTGMPHSQVVDLMLQGKADVGIVRSGVLEQMQAQGQLDLTQLRVLNPQHVSGFGQLLSTPLSPEWPMAALRHTAPGLAKEVTIALLQISADSQAARTGRYQGFSTPADYTPVEDLMRRLRVYPGQPERPLWLALWQDHQGQILLVALMSLSLGLALAAYLWRSNRRLRELTRLNLEAQTALEVTAAAFNSQVGLIITDEFTLIKRANPAMTAILGYSQDDLAGRPTASLRGLSVPAGTLRTIWGQLQVQGHWQGELPCRHRSGHDVSCMVTITAVRSERAALRGFVGSFTDISQQKQAEADIRQLAYFDPLTQLPNRRMFLEGLQTAMHDAVRNGTLACVMFIDLDHFKNLNDAHGHAVGDQLLNRIAARLLQLTGPKDIAARLGGDEFVMMLSGLDTQEDKAIDQALAVAQSVRRSLLVPFELDTPNDLGEHTQTLRYNCTGSIGVALFGMMQEPLTEVLKRADVAMYKAKQDGRNVIRLFEPAAQKALNERMALSHDLNLALRDGQLRLQYQLQVNGQDEAVSAECLMRWQHPSKGQVSPAQFIPLAEESGAIIAMGDWVVQSACQTLVRWASLPALRHMSLSVNVSPRQFSEDDFVARIQHILHDTGARPQLLRLEVTEGIVMQDTQQVIARMQQLCQLGVSFSIDDFGTGYSSLSYIQMLPLAELKIDKSFVHDLTTNERSQAIVKAILALGHSMNITIVSEGVETQAQKDQLLALGCTLLQGYLISRPMERAELEQRVTSHHATLDPSLLLL